MARKFDIPSLQCVMTCKKFGIKLPGKTAFFSAGHQVACRDTKKNVQNWRISRWSKNCQLPAIDNQLQMYRKSHRSKRLNTISGTGFSISINEVNTALKHTNSVPCLSRTITTKSSVFAEMTAMPSVFVGVHRQNVYGHHTTYTACQSRSLHRESKKTRHLTLAHNFTKYWPTFKILSLLYLVGNL